MKLHPVKNHAGTAKNIIHIAFDIAVFHQHTADTVGHGEVFTVTGIEIYRILAPNQPHIIQLHAIPVRAQRDALMGAAVNGIQQRVHYAESRYLEIVAL